MSKYFTKKRTKRGLLFFGIAVLSFTIMLAAATLTLIIMGVMVNRADFDEYTISYMALVALSFIFSFAVVLTFYIIAQKLRVLAEGLKKVAEGDYSAEITVRRGDMFTTVYRNFNTMTKELNSVKTLRDDFVRNFSHEIKTPLFSMQGFANLLLEGGLTEEEKTKFLHIISDEAGRLLRLAEGTLLLSKLENQQLLGERKPVRLDIDITDCIVMLEREWEKKEIEIVSELSPIGIMGDGESLKQVWLNILSNAIKFTPEKGKIEISLKKQDNFAVAAFKDSGMGISPEDIPRVFDKFYRAPTASSFEGNGLGLAVCKRITELCGGEISVSSDGEGKGACVTVKLPITQDLD